ncbi:glycosyltransferase, partial [Streptomyces sp. NPDC048551]|uniref:glycosyltransferase n=1 Tax=Streptomyces sp. NPDC048551 TaxID=3155758 RepID=UPI00342B933B
MSDGGQRTYGPLGTTLVIIPTYNEAENIGLITGRVRAAVPQAHILVADDNSPDGTGKLADELAAADDHVHVLHRKGKEGLGAAYLAGFVPLHADRSPAYAPGGRRDPALDEVRDVVDKW